MLSIVKLWYAYKMSMKMNHSLPQIPQAGPYLRNYPCYSSATDPPIGSQTSGNRIKNTIFCCAQLKLSYTVYLDVKCGLHIQDNTLFIVTPHYLTIHSLMQEDSQEPYIGMLEDNMATPHFKDIDMPI